MFDDLAKKTGAVEDIFSGTESEAKPSILKPVQPSSNPAGDPSMDRKKEGGKKLMVFVGLLFGMIVIFGGVFLVLKKINNSLTKNSQETQIPLEETNVENSTEETGAVDDFLTPTETELTSVVETGPIDTDQDGLTDEEEAQLGTSSDNIDTDSDGLFDREEVKVYETDPANPDTDGDSFSDGDEVKNGYNPSGSGKLYEIK